MSFPSTHAVQIYYEDTDHSGVVYHANYLKYFERAREHLLGVEMLVSLLRDQGLGFVVYKAELTYKKGAVFGDSIEIRTTPTLESEYRVSFQQDVYRPLPASPQRDELLVLGKIEMVCVDRESRLAKIPDAVIARVRERGHAAD